MERLKELRITAGLSQTQLARKLGCSRMTIGRWEQGRIPNGKYLLKLAEALHTTPNDLMGVKEDEVAPR